MDTLLSSIRAYIVVHYISLITCMSLAVNVGLTWHLIHLDRASTEAASAPLLPLAGLDDTGAKTVVDLGTPPRPTVLYVTRSECSECVRNEDNIRTIANVASGTYRFIGLAVNNTDVASLRRSYAFPVIAGVSVQALARAGFIRLPHTFVLDDLGRIKKSWAGSYAGATQREIEEWFHTALPGPRGPATASQPSVEAR